MFNKIIIATIVVVIAATITISATRVIENVPALVEKSGNCGIIATPCDNTWSSRYNQTFSFEAAGNYIQLVAWWQKDRACLSNKNTTPFDFYYTVCQGNSSLWSYGPGSIKSYVYYNNTQNLCLTRSEYPIHSSSSYHFGLKLEDCCIPAGHSGKGNVTCSQDMIERQMWLENPITTDPYNRINNMKLERGVSKSGMICLTRVSDTC